MWMFTKSKILIGLLIQVVLLNSIGLFMWARWWPITFVCNRWSLDCRRILMFPLTGQSLCTIIWSSFSVILYSFPIIPQFWFMCIFFLLLYFLVYFLCTYRLSHDYLNWKKQSNRCYRPGFSCFFLTIIPSSSCYIYCKVAQSCASWGMFKQISVSTGLGRFNLLCQPAS